MKKNYKLFLIALVATVGFTSCGKDDDTSKNVATDAGKNLGISVGGKTYLVDKLKYSDDEYSSAEYDSQGRLTKFTDFENGKSDYYSSLVYSGNTVTVTGFDEGIAEGKIVATLGANGYASDFVSTEEYKENGFTRTYKSTGKLTHNAEGYVTKIVTTDVESSTDPSAPQSTETSTTNYTYLNGNLASKTETYVDNNGQTKTYNTTYEYYLDKNYSPALDLDEFEFLLTKPSKNLLKKEIQTNSESGSTPYTSNYTYTFNADGLPSTFTTDNYTTTISYIVK